MKDKDAMLAAMKKEIGLRAPDNSQFSTLNSQFPIETLYFGGGTPSVLSIDDISGLLETVTKYYTLAPDAEITLEANPDDLRDDYIIALRNLGFNRLSIGVQSFFDDDLQWMNRRHNAAEALQSVITARQHGFNNINIDLIYGLPNMTCERWKENLNQAISLDIPHLSAYHLTIEPRTVFGKRSAKGQDFSIHEDESIRQFEMLLDIMEKNGYEHYEISNFARAGFRSRHNCAYWQQRHYIGIGPSAHSYDGKSRQWNISNNTLYIAAIENSKYKIQKWYEREELTIVEQYNDYILVSLRTVYGANLKYIREHFGVLFEKEFLRQAATYLQNDYIQEKNGVFTLTRKGKMLSDRITSDLFIDD